MGRVYEEPFARGVLGEKVLKYLLTGCVGVGFTAFFHVFLATVSEDTDIDRLIGCLIQFVLCSVAFPIKLSNLVGSQEFVSQHQK